MRRKGLLQADGRSCDIQEMRITEQEGELIEWIQKALGSLNGMIGAILSFIGGEICLLPERKGFRAGAEKRPRMPRLSLGSV